MPAAGRCWRTGPAWPTRHATSGCAQAGVAGLDELREACAEMGVRLIACEAGLRAEAIEASGLLPGVEVAGVATFLSAVGAGQLATI